MRELWELTGENFVLPISVEPSETAFAVRLGAGLRLLQKQRDSGGALLDAVATKRVGGRWFVTQEQLTVVARRSQQTEPEEVLFWTPERNVTVMPSLTKRWRGFLDSFVAKLTKAGFPMDSQEITETWVSFCNVLLEILVVEEKPIDLFFCEIYPTALRPNIQDLFFSASLIRKGVKTPSVMLEAKVNLNEFNGDPWFLMVRPDDGNIHLARRLGIRATQYWMKAAAGNEKVRFGYYGAVDYCRKAMERCKKYWQHEHKTFAAHNNYMVKARGRVCGDDGEDRLVAANQDHGKRPPWQIDGLSLDILGFPAGKQSDLDGKDKILHEMPGVERQGETVRYPGPDGKDRD